MPDCIIPRAVDDRAKALLGRPVNPGELSLMYRLRVQILRGQDGFNPQTISPEEREILAQWAQDDWIIGSEITFRVNRWFWHALDELAQRMYLDALPAKDLNLTRFTYTRD